MAVRTVGRTSLRCLHASSSRSVATFSTSAAGLRWPLPQDGERAPTSWSKYMGCVGDTDGDSPWASLDEIADGYRDLSKAPSPSPTPHAAKPAANEPTSEWESTAAMAAEAFAATRLHSLQPTPIEAPQLSPGPPRLTHVHEDDNSRASMVDVSAKANSKRTATASCRVYIPERVLALLQHGQDGGSSDQDSGSVRHKGPVLHTAQLAGIMAAKRTSELIPLCHGLHLSHVDVKLDVVREGTADYIHVECVATTNAPTGVEMEALTGASVASLTLWDMLKSAGGREMRIEGLMVTRKTGGKSGDFEREDVAM